MHTLYVVFLTYVTYVTINVRTRHTLCENPHCGAVRVPLMKATTCGTEAGVRRYEVGRPTTVLGL